MLGFQSLGLAFQGPRALRRRFLPKLVLGTRVLSGTGFPRLEMFEVHPVLQRKQCRCFHDQTRLFGYIVYLEDHTLPRFKGT